MSLAPHGKAGGEQTSDLSVSEAEQSAICKEAERGRAHGTLNMGSSRRRKHDKKATHMQVGLAYTSCLWQSHRGIAICTNTAVLTGRGTLNHKDGR